MNDKTDDTPEFDAEAEAEALKEEAEAAADAPAGDADDPVTALREENEQLRDRALRALAEMENTRKRAERDVAAARAYAIERFAADLIGVADNMKRALESLPAEAREQGPEILRTLVSGVELTDKELMKAFERHGVTQEDPKGEPFDPNRHQAVAQIPSSAPAGHVAEVMQTGYRIGDRILRAAMVAVSTGQTDNAEDTPAPQDDHPDGPPGGQADIKI